MEVSQTAEEYVKAFAKANQCVIDCDLWANILSILESLMLRVSDVCNLLLVASRVKPTCLVVCDNEEQCVALGRAIKQLDKVGLHMTLHNDPAVDKYYVICCTSPDKVLSIRKLTNEAQLMKTKISKLSIVRISSDSKYHIDLGKFLDVPKCCLVAYPVMPADADERFFSLLREENENNKSASAVNFSSHLPCCVECIATKQIGSIYESWIHEHVPDFAAQLASERHSKPLYLY